eukprot:778763-Alexandrium_andersonii.AAC.1
MPPPSPAEPTIDNPEVGESGQALDAIIEEDADFGDGPASSPEKEAGDDLAMPQAKAGLPSADEPAPAGAVGGA